MATRRWIELLAENLPQDVPFYALMDGGETDAVLSLLLIKAHDIVADAYGMHIYHTYQSSIRHFTGSRQQMAHRLQWIGLKPSDTLS